MSWPPRSERTAKLVVREVRHERRQAGAPARESLAQLAGVRAQEALVLLVRHLVDPPPQVLPARPLEERLEPAAVLDGQHLPAGRLEHAREAAERDVWDDPVERLAVQVNDPQDLTEPGDPGVGDRLPDGALVELGVAQERDLAPARRRLEAVVLEVPARDRAPDRRGRADADRPRRVVHRIRVLRTARIAL